jgi:hypothetical protein
VSQAEITSAAGASPRGDPRRPAPAAALSGTAPTAHFGLRAAVLAGVIVLAGAVTAPPGAATVITAPVTVTVGLGAVINDLMALPQTTCCAY